MNIIEKKLERLERMAYEAKEYGFDMFLDTHDGDACVGIHYDRDDDAFHVGFFCKDDDGKMFEAESRGPYPTEAEAAWRACGLYLASVEQVKERNRELCEA